MACVLHRDISLERAIVAERQFGLSLNQRLLRWRHWSGNPGRRFLIGKQGLFALFLPAQHTKRNVVIARVEELPRSSNVDSDILWSKKVVVWNRSIKEDVAAIGSENNTSIKAGSCCQRREEKIDI